MAELAEERTSVEGQVVSEFKADVQSMLRSKADGMNDDQYEELFKATKGNLAQVQHVERTALPSWSQARYNALMFEYRAALKRNTPDEGWTPSCACLSKQRAIYQTGENGWRPYLEDGPVCTPHTIPVAVASPAFASFQNVLQSDDEANSEFKSLSVKVMVLKERAKQAVKASTLPAAERGALLCFLGTLSNDDLSQIDDDLEDAALVGYLSELKKRGAGGARGGVAEEAAAPFRKKPRLLFPPSDLGRELAQQQQDPRRQLDIDRPFEHPPDVLDVALTFPRFGEFRDLLRTCHPTSAEEELCSQLMTLMSKFHDKEEHRVDAVVDYLNDFFMKQGVPCALARRVYKGGIDDGSCCVSFSSISVPFVIFVFKNAMGLSGNAGAQGVGFAQLAQEALDGMAKLKFWPCPIIVVEAPGANLRFWGAVWPGGPRDYVRASCLSDMMATVPSFPGQRETLARALAAFVRTLPRLRTHYEDRNSAPSAQLSRTWPLPPPFAIIERGFTEMRNDPQLFFRHPMYICRRSASAAEALVKFVWGGYGEKAHRICAALGLAPRLLECRPLPGGYTLVVMEHLGDEFHPLYGQSRAVIDVVKASMLAALCKIREAMPGFVHGDLRTPNVYFTKDSDEAQYRIMLLDFDWAGVEGGVQYPGFLSRSYPPYVQSHHDIVATHHECMVQAW